MKGRTYAQIPGSMVNRAEDLVFRDYDFQPIPDQARLAPHVPPFCLKERRPAKTRVAIVRGPHLDPDEIRGYAPLQEFFDLTVYTTGRSQAEPDLADIPVVWLPNDPQVATAMAGLEYALFDADIIFVAQIVWPYAYQAIRVKEKFGQKVIALHTDALPFAYEENAALKSLKQYNRPMVDMFIAATGGNDMDLGRVWGLGLAAALKRL